MRLFIAALLPQEIKARLGEYVGVIKESCGGVKWESREKLHITLKFLGGVEDPKAREVSSLIEGILSGHDPFIMETLNFGGFPDLVHPRVLYVAMSENPRLRRLHLEIDEALEPLGFAGERRRFVPHVTIGRVRRGFGIRGSLPLPDKIGFTIDEIGVIKSETRKEGSVYTPVEVFKLG